MFRYLTSATLSVRDTWPGAVVAGIAYTLLQHFGTRIVRRITDNAGVAYGQFALVLGLVTWLSLLSIATIMSCELNAAIARYRNGSLTLSPESDAATYSAEKSSSGVIGEAGEDRAR